MKRPPATLDGGAAFEAMVSPTVMLDADFVIRAANPAYLRATERDSDQLLSVNLFDAMRIVLRKARR